MSDAEWQATGLTLKVAFVAVLASLPWAIGVGWILARYRFPGKFLLESIVNLPLVLPPVVTGYLLLVSFGAQGWIGQWLDSVFQVRFVFDWKGAVLASMVVSFPLMVRPIRQAFSALDPRLIVAARTLGATRWDAFRSIAIPLALPGFVSGCVLAFARSVGEFGATLMVAGNLVGETQTIPLYIYDAIESPQGMARAGRMILVSVLVAVAALLASEFLERRGQSRIRSER